MKRVFCVVMAVLLCVALTACGDPTPKEITEQTLKVAIICAGDSQVETSQATAYAQQLQNAAQMVQLQSGQYAICDGISPNNAALAEEAIRDCIEDGFGVVCGTAAGYAPAMKKLAAEYPRVTFVQVGEADETLPNYYAYQVKTYEAAYFCGLVAGFHTQSGKLGMIVSETESVEAHQMANAFLLGVQVKKPDATLLVQKAFAEEENRVAANNLYLEGCDGILVTTDSAEALSFLGEGGIRTYVVYGQPEMKDTVGYAVTVTHQNQLGDTLQAVLSKQKPYYNNMYVGYADGFLQCQSGFDGGGSNDAVSVPAEVQKLLRKGTWDVFSGVKLAWDGMAYMFAETPAAIRDADGNVRIAAGAGIPTAETLNGMNWWMQGVSVLQSEQ